MSSTRPTPRPPYDPIGFALKLDYTKEYAAANKVVYRWHGTHWDAIPDEGFERQALTWLIDDGQWPASAANARAACATAAIYLPQLHDPVETPIIPVKNGYLHLDHGVCLKPADKALGLRHVLRCEYDPLADEPEEFLGFLNRVLPNPDVQARVQEYVGYTLLPDTRFQRAQIWLGTGANGKGTLVNIVQGLHARTAAIQLDALDGFRAANMIGASLVYCDEAPQRGINEQFIKSLIAGELVQIDRKYRDPVDVRITGKWLILANHIPAVTDQSIGFWRRFDIVPFNVEIPAGERDPMLARRIIDRELSGVLNWAIQGLTRLLARGRFDERLPDVMRAATETAKIETNSVAAWIQACDVSLATVSDTLRTDVYEHYDTWCKRNGMKSVGSPKFWARLKDSMYPLLKGRQIKDGHYHRVCNIVLPV